MDIRKATAEDAAAIARNVMAAMGYDVFSGTVDSEQQAMLEGMTEICAREDTLYSWRNTLVAVAEALGFRKVSLIALASSDRLIAFYESFGFRPDCHLNCFGHDYLRMVAEI